MACTLGIGALSVVALRWSSDPPAWLPAAPRDEPALDEVALDEVPRDAVESDHTT